MKTILAADIGGTHSRFAAFRTGEERRLELIRSLWLNISIPICLAAQA